MELPSMKWVEEVWLEELEQTKLEVSLLPPEKTDQGGCWGPG